MSRPSAGTLPFRSPPPTSTSVKITGIPSGAKTWAALIRATVTAINLLMWGRGVEKYLARR